MIRGAAPDHELGHMTMNTSVNMPINSTMNMKPHLRTGLALLGTSILILAGCASPPAPPPEAPPVAQACPQGVPEGARCLRGQDSAASHYLIVMPAQWSGVLVVHAHGGPSLGPPKTTRADEDITHGGGWQRAASGADLCRLQRAQLLGRRLLPAAV